MKTLQIVGDSKFGGATILLLAWCRFLRERGCEVDVLTTDAATRERLRDIPGVRVIDDILIPRDVSPGQDIRALTRLISLMRRNRYDVAHTYTAVPGFVGRLAARCAGVPVILHHQAGWTINEFSSGLKRMLFSRLEYLATALSTRAICVSHATMRQAQQQRLAPLNKLVTICNGIDAGPFQGRKEEKEKRRKGEEEIRGGEDSSLIPHPSSLSASLSLIPYPLSLTLGNSGRLAAQKDNAALLHALPILQTLLPDTRVTLRLAGDGPERARLQALADTLGLTANLEFVGFTRDIPAFLQSLDVFVSPSLREGLSISLLEAMAAGLPIVTTSIAPNAELVEQEVTGLLVPIHSPEALAHAIARFATNPELAERCGGNARERALKRYTIDRMCRETWDLYQTLSSERQPHGVPVHTTQAT